MSGQTFAEALVKALDATGTSRSELARRLDLGQSTVSHWANGRENPRAARIPSIAQALDVTFLAHAGGWAVARKRGENR